ncbi:exodeoxyribonuclease VII small subunit [Thermogutta sp.]|uniref:exodeoxyribonuclease VII small subunit n=1 Tax=Thermogutta sp. TaxID=1962930 RepID=UPI00321FC4CB
MFPSTGDPSGNEAAHQPAESKGSTMARASQGGDYPQGAEENLSFEEAMTELERVVEQLERGNLGLDAALRAYEKGIRLIRRCRELLTRAEQRIEILTGIDENGTPITKPFVEEEMSLEEKREKRSRRRGAKEQES